MRINEEVTLARPASDVVALQWFVDNQLFESYVPPQASASFVAAHLDQRSDERLLTHNVVA
jgi:hypothetical protein